MSLEIRIDVTLDTVTPALKAKGAAIRPHAIATRIAPPLAQHWRDHLASLPKNKKGYPSTGFWEDAARKVVGVALDDACLLSCDKLGIRQRYRGGPITAIKGQYLTIPICAEAYGTTVADWGRDSLTLVILSDGRKFLALWLGSEEAKSAYKSAGVGKRANKAAASARAAQRIRYDTLQKMISRGGDSRPKVIVFRPKSGKSPASEASRTEKHLNLKFLFKLQHSVEQEGNPNVIPPDMPVMARQEVLKAIT